MHHNKHHSYHEQDTESYTKFRSRKWWAKWLSISGIATIAAVLMVLPQIKEFFAYGHDLVTAPTKIQALQTDSMLAVKTVQGEIDTLQMHEYEGKIWRAKTDERLDNIEKMLSRILDNQERQYRYSPSPKNQTNQP